MKTSFKLLLFSLVIVITECEQTNLRLLITPNHVQMKLNQSISYNLKIDIVNLKAIQVVYADCDIGKIRINENVTRCVKLKIREPDRIIEGPKISQKIALDFDVYGRDDIDLMQPIMLDYYDNVLSVLVILPTQFSMVGYHINFDRSWYSLFVDYRKQPIYETHALDFLRSDLSQKEVRFISMAKEDASRQVFASQWIIINEQTGIFFLSKQKVEIKDMRIQLTDKGPLFFFYRNNQAFEAKALRKDRILSYTTLDKTETIKYTECQDLPNYHHVSAGNPVQKEGAFMTIGVQRLVESNTAVLSEQLIRSSNFNDYLPEYILNLNTQDSLIHFELHKDIDVAQPISFQVIQSTKAVQFIFATKESHGVVQQRRFKIEVADYMYIQLKSRLPQSNTIDGLDMTRGIYLDEPVFGQLDQCAFLQASSLVRSTQIIDGRRGKAQVHYDYGWIKNIDASTIQMHQLEIYHEYDSKSRVLTVYLYNAASLALMLVDESGVSISYKTSGQQSSHARSNLDNRELSDFCTTDNIKKTQLTLLRSTSSTETRPISLFEIRGGRSYFVSIDTRLRQIFDGQPAIDVRFYTEESVEFIIFNLAEIILAAQIEDHTVVLTHKQFQRKLTTPNSASLANTDFVMSTANTPCQNLGSIFLRSTLYQPTSSMKLVILNAKTTGLFLTSVLPNINRVKNFVSVLDVSLPKLSQSQHENFFFNRSSDICHPSVEKIVKFTLSLSHVTFHDPQSDRTVQYPIEQIFGFKDIQMASVQDQPQEFLLCVGRSRRLGTLSLGCDTKRGVIYDPREEIRSLLFAGDIEEKTIFNNVKVFAAKTGDLIKINLVHEPGKVEITFADQKMSLRSGKQIVTKNIDSAEYWSAKLVNDYTEADLSLSLLGLDEASGEYAGGQNEVSQAWKELRKSFSSPIKFEVTANVESSFIQSLFANIQMSSSSIAMALLETAPSKISFIVYNKLSFELVKVSNLQAVRLERPRKALGRSSIIQKVILDPFSELRRQQSGLTSSVASLYQEPVEVQLFDISNNFQNDANSVCIDESDCRPIKLFPTRSVDVSYLLMFKDDIEYLKNMQFSVEVVTAPKPSALVGQIIRISDPATKKVIV